MRKRITNRLSGWWAFADDTNTPPADPPKDDPKPDDKPEDQPRPSNDAAYWRRQAEKNQKELEKLQKADEDRKKADMSETERLKAEKAEADKKAAAALTTANQRAVAAEARVQAVALGIKPERIPYALKLVDMTTITVDDAGEPDSKALTAALEKVLTDMPELKAETQATSGGADFGNGQRREGDKPLTDELIADMSKEELARRMPEITAYYAKKKK